MDWEKIIGISIVVIFYFFCLLPHIKEVNTKYCTFHDLKIAKIILTTISGLIVGIIILCIATTSFL